MSDLEKVKQQYIDKFGGYPAFLLMGASDDYIIEALSKAIASGQELTAADDEDLY